MAEEEKELNNNSNTHGKDNDVNKKSETSDDVKNNVESSHASEEEKSGNEEKELADESADSSGDFEEEVSPASVEEVSDEDFEADEAIELSDEESGIGETRKLSEETPPSIDDVEDSELRLKIDAKVEEYERELQKKYRRIEDRQLIQEKKKQFREKLIEREIQDESRNIEDIRKEEHFNISLNLILSMFFLLIFMIWAKVNTKGLEEIARTVSHFFISNFNWFYILASSGFLIYLVYMAFSRFGNVVLGDPGEQPEFSDFSWYAMLFSAGMGVGMLFWGGAEPVAHFIDPPVGAAKTVEAARLGMVYSAFHWGLHAWAIYTTCALGVAYYGFRKRKKYLVSSSVMDIFSSPKVNQWLKIISDLISTLAIVFGVAASLGLGVLQISRGLNLAYKIDSINPKGYIIITIIMTVLFIISATTGLKKGIKILSNVNMLVAIALMVFVFFVGPKLFILKVFVDTIGQYIGNLFQLGFKIAPFTPEYEGWMGEWTLTYFTWWIAWAPFVGIFIARISRGRTIKELILGALIVPTIFCILWFSVFGGAALHMEIFTNDSIADLVQHDPEAALFAMLEHYPFYKLISGVAIFLLFTFLITSADSATFVVSMMTTEGDLEPKLGMKVMWGVVLAILTILLVVGGEMEALRAAALTSAFPFSLVLILITISVHIRLSMQVEQKRI